MKTLTVILVALKLLNVIKWSWFWVLSPIWAPVLFFAAVFVYILIGGRLVKGHW